MVEGVRWDISRETLAKIESQIRWVADSELFKLAEALDIDPCELLTGAKPSPRKPRPRA